MLRDRDNYILLTYVVNKLQCREAVRVYPPLWIIRAFFI